MVHAIDVKATVPAGSTAAAAQETGQLGPHQVRIGQPQSRAAEVLKSLWAQFKRFVTSLLRMNVKVAAPAPVTDLPTAARAALHHLSQRRIDHLSALSALHELATHVPAPETKDEARRWLTEGAKAGLAAELRTMSDADLLRLNATYRANPAYVASLGQVAFTVMGNREGDMQERGVAHANIVRGAGVMNDIAMISATLLEATRTEIDTRGLSAPAPAAPDLDDENLPHEIQTFSAQIVETFGDFDKALRETKAILGLELIV